MRRVTKGQINTWKKGTVPVPKIDYTMNTRYYRAVDGDNVLQCSVDPFLAAQSMVGHHDAQLWEIKL